MTINHIANACNMIKLVGSDHSGKNKKIAERAGWNNGGRSAGSGEECQIEAYGRFVMGRVSTNPNKTIYQERREELGLSRDKASELMMGISPERIEKIENGKSEIRPDEIRQMAEAYRDPGLCNYYCANDCDLGKGKVPVVEGKELTQIAVQTYNLLNRMENEKDRLMEIVEDEAVTADEYEDFLRIKETLLKMSHTIDSLDLWLQEKMATGEVEMK